MKTLLKNALDNGINTLYDRYWRDKKNTELVISGILGQIEANHELKISFPSDYVELLRGCIEIKKLKVKEIKKVNSAPTDKTYYKQFLTLISVLKNNLIPIKIDTAQEIALIADSFRSATEVYQESNWVGDIHTHFGYSSSFGEKGRILNTVIRIMRSQNCLELGTAYGMSALFIMEALKSIGESGTLDTIEGGTSQYNLSSKILKERYGNQINCHLGMTQDLIPELVKSLDKLDFVFHDAGHRKENYIRDFNNLLPVLKSGCIFLIDDIRWDAPLLANNPCCYEGWMEIVNHPQVIYAVEVNKSLGLALIG